MNPDRNPHKPLGAEWVGAPLRRIEQLPRPLLRLYVGLVAIGSVFSWLLAAYVYTHMADNIASGMHQLPRFFSLSTIVLLGSSYVISQALRLYAQDDLTMLARCLGATLLLGSVFVGLQLLGGYELLRQGLRFTTHADNATYLYLVLGLHALHVLAGTGYLLVLLLQVAHADQDAVRALVFIRNPYYRQKIQAISTYWHFVAGLWLVLFAAFLVLY